MRLIDADALMQKLSRMIDYCKTDGKVTGLTALFQVGDAVMDCKTINPESLRPEGEWEEKPSGRYGAWQSWCSVCGKHSGIGGIESNRHKPYCPQLRGEDERRGRE